MKFEEILNTKQPYSKIGLLAFLLLSSLYLDSSLFSFQTPIGRFRPNIIIILCIGIWMSLKFLIQKNSSYKINVVKFFLIAYVGANFISLLFTDYNSLRFSYGIKIIFLLICWLIVHFFITERCSNKIRALKFAKYFFYVGFLQAGIGIVQMLGSFVRPTGTISIGDADYFGIAMMGYLLVLLTLKILKVIVISRRIDYVLMIFLCVNLFFSFVRSGWFGFIAGVCFLLFIAKFGVLNKNLIKWKKIISLISAIALIVFLSYMLSPSLQEYTTSRIISRESDGNSIENNIRFVMMAESWRNALNSPIIGNGPAAFAIQGLALDIPLNADFAFDPSIITTLMNDTGIVGVTFFFFFLWTLFSNVFRTFRTNPDNILAKYAIAFSIGVFGLLISYIPTTALWLPYSWVFFSLPTALSASVKLSR